MTYQNLNLNKKIQQRLIQMGYDIGPSKDDGIIGPLTKAAIIDFKVKHGLRARAYVGPITLQTMGIQVEAFDPILEPWINELYKFEGIDESNPRIAEWLKSDGGTLGNPDDFPWCGDAMHTAVRNTLPDEKFKGDLGKNPYLAKNWLNFGEELDELCYGAMIVLWRKSPSSIYGHIACAVGYDPKLKRIRMLGGNQSDEINESWIAYDPKAPQGKRNRLRKGGIRWPSTYTGPKRPIPIMDSSGAILSTDEA